ncbi:Doublecortin [Desmophyllum pertusum]|uniref:Doublecortin n=1 Tax=Desmophyllum pertusum TaxID=174260 RepID=A0A9W9ZNG4_9CNID|nr:Doublecortin [Desmophyllum pertusum]
MNQLIPRMAAVSSFTAPTVTVKVYKNGNRNFTGKTIVINRRHIRTMDALYDEVTSHIAAFNAVRKICTPIGGRPVMSLENIQNKSVYVAAGREVFKKLNYADLGVSRPRPPRKTNNSPKKAFIATEGRHKMDYEWGKRDLRIIHVFCNGNVFKPSAKIVLQKRLQQSMDQILSIVQEHVFLAAAIAALYTIDGKLVLAPSQLVSGQNYVAVERGRIFKRENYGGAASSLSRSPRAPFLPQIGNGQLTNTEGRLPRKIIAKRKPRVTKTNAENKTSDYSPRDQSRVITDESPRDVISNSSPDPPLVTSLLLASAQDNFTISASPPRLLEDDTPVQEDNAALVIAEDNKDDDLTEIGNVFKASGLLQEKADEIKGYPPNKGGETNRLTSGGSNYGGSA